MKENKMGVKPLNKLIWEMGLPMVISMVLQALYNVIDSIFVTNIGSDGIIANQALTIAFPIQILMIALGVGTGIGINSLLSKNLGEGNKGKVNKVAGNGIFLSIVIFLIFFLFGIFLAEPFIKLFVSDSKVIEYGTSYLKIVTIFSFGSIAYTVYERFLQATGKTNYSTIAQITGALLNVLLDYIFIYPLNMGVSGAAWATIIGQFASLILGMIFHYTKNSEIKHSLSDIKPDKEIIKEIYQIGLSAFLMQALLSVMMAGMNLILGNANANSSILVGSFGIYYKIQQIALFSAFGLSNAIISILSFNYGMKDRKRIDDTIKYGIKDTLIVTLIITIIFEIFAPNLARLFGLSGGSSTEIIDVCTKAIRISSIGYIFMGLSVSIQGVLQALRYALRPLLISLFRLVIFVFPIAYLFTLSDNVTNLVWFTFPISEILTSIIAYYLYKKSYKESISTIKNKNTYNNLIISISREHGTNGKEIGKLVANKLNIKFYDKEEIKEYAIKNNLVSNDIDMYDNFLSLDVSKDSIINTTNVIKDIALNNSCVIVGRASDYILKDNRNLISIFIYASDDYRIKNIMHNYHDSRKSAISNMQKSDKSRSKYYELVTNQKWGDKKNYDLCIDASIGNDNVVKIIIDYINNKMK